MHKMVDTDALFCYLLARSTVLIFQASILTLRCLILNLFSARKDRGRKLLSNARDIMFSCFLYLFVVYKLLGRHKSAFLRSAGFVIKNSE